MSAPFTFTAADKRKECQREAAMRRSVYVRRVAAGKMTQAQAERQTALMDAMAADYAAIEAAEPLL